MPEAPVIGPSTSDVVIVVAIILLLGFIAGLIIIFKAAANKARQQEESKVDQAFPTTPPPPPSLSRPMVEELEAVEAPRGEGGQPQGEVVAQLPPPPTPPQVQQTQFKNENACVACGQPADPIGADIELWEQINTIWGRFMAMLNVRVGVAPGRELFHKLKFCRGCGLLADKGERVYKKREEEEDEEYAAQKAANRQHWDRVGLVEYVQAERQKAIERYDARKKQVERDKLLGR
jgi:hypothetical protein